MARALMTRPEVLLLDEPCLGLSAANVGLVFSRIRDLAAGPGPAVVVVEQKIGRVLDAADSAVALRGGRVAYAGDPHGLQPSFRRRAERGGADWWIADENGHRLVAWMCPKSETMCTLVGGLPEDRLVSVATELRNGGP